MLRLVAEGFSEQEVLDLPLNKVVLYLEGVSRKNAYRRQEAFADLVNAIGVSLSGKGFDKYIDALGVDDG